MAIQWHTESRLVASLLPWDRNPRIIKGREFSKLKKSIDKFGLAEPIVVQPQGLIIGGPVREDGAKWSEIHAVAVIS